MMEYFVETGIEFFTGCMHPWEGPLDEILYRVCDNDTQYRSLAKSFVPSCVGNWDHARNSLFPRFAHVTYHLSDTKQSERRLRYF